MEQDFIYEEKECCSLVWQKNASGVVQCCQHIVGDVLFVISYYLLGERRLKTMWECEECGHMNEDDTEICEMCGFTAFGGLTGVWSLWG